MTSPFRTLMLWTAAAVVAGFGAASVASHRPRGVTNRSLAMESLKRALIALDDEALVSTARLAVYGDGLAETEALLRRALRACPTDTSSIERLATVRWESGVLAGTPDGDSVSSLIEIAARRAPRVPAIQTELAELSYRMGHREDAARFMAKAVSLSPSTASRAVTAMTGAGVLPETIAGQLPRVPEVLIALKSYYLNTNQALEFVILVEPDLPRFGSKLLPIYGDACLRAKEPERLVRTAEALGQYPNREDETERQRQLAAGYAATDNAPSALLAIDRAVQLSPLDPTLKETNGTMLLAAGRPAEAEDLFRAALTDISATARFQWLRPRLYADVGLALDAQGQAEAAVDSYRMALQRNPAESVASARLRAINTLRPPIGAPSR
jgi:tetratricopeptide (TPR) repeat protein